MAPVTGRNLLDETHRASCIRAAPHGRGIEAEIRAILESVVLPEERVKLGTLLAEIGREVGGVDLELEFDRAPTEPMSFVNDPARYPRRF